MKKTFKKTIVSMLLLMTLLVLGACAQDALVLKNDVSETSETMENQVETESADQVVGSMRTQYPITITDHYNREVVIVKKPEVVISVAPSITETIFSINGQAQLKGRTDYCTYPEEAQNIPSIGSLRNPSIEAIAAMQPDLVLGSTHFQEETLNKLEELGITVVILSSQDSFEGVYDVIEKTGLILDHQDEATQCVKTMKDTVDRVTETVGHLSPVEAYYVIGYGEYGDYTAGGGTFISHMIEMAGGTNAASDTEGWSYSIEKLVEKDPYLLICSKFNNDLDNIKVTNGYKDLTAIKEDRIFEIDDNLLDRQGPRLAEGLEALAKILHPEAFY